MNLVIQPSKYSQDYVHFLDTKTNMIMDGNFTKLMYTTDHMTMNGIFIEFPIELDSVQSFAPATNSIHPSTSTYASASSSMSTHIQKYNGETKYIMKFETDKNKPLLENLVKIEDSLLTYYMEYLNISKKHKLYSLSNQLQHGSAKFFCTANYQGRHSHTISNSRKYFIKISGIWENNYEIGITYKIFEKVG
jgi:hypothetical protein